MARTYEELLAAQTELAHFNPNHDPNTGQFASVKFATYKAKKDAKEFARAKMFYGEGAGNRRKLISATVKERSKDPKYKEAFDRYYSEQDMSKHASAAKAERRTKDVGKAAGKTARGIYHLTVGDAAKVSAAVALGYGILKATGGDKKVAEFAKNRHADIKDLASTAAEKAKMQKIIKQWGKAVVV